MELAKEKRGHFFVPFILPEGNFFKICVLSQCIVYWTYFQNIHTFTYQKHHTLNINIIYFIHCCCLFLKSSKAFSASLSKLLIIRIMIALKGIQNSNQNCRIRFCYTSLDKKATHRCSFPGPVTLQVSSGRHKKFLYNFILCLLCLDIFVLFSFYFHLLIL